MIKYESGSFYDKNWSEIIGTYSKKAVIPDEETALKIEPFLREWKKVKRRRGMFRKPYFTILMMKYG